MASRNPLLSSRLLLLAMLPWQLFALPPAFISLPPSSSSPHNTPPSNSSFTFSLPPVSSPLTAGRDLECFNLTTPNAYPVDLSDCPPAIDLLYHDPTGVMTLQQFSRNPFLPSTFRVPHDWQFGACQVLLTSAADMAVDTFKLADVIVKALRIMDECPPKSKKALGGLALVGHGETFFVAVNGPDLAPDGEAGGSGDVVGSVTGAGDDGSGVGIVDPDPASEGLMVS